MAYDIGTTIGIEGESEFRKAIEGINDNLKTLGTEMKATASQFDKSDTSVTALSSKNEVLNKQIEEQKNKLSELQKGLAASNEKYGENDKVTNSWKRSVNQATADLNKMERELQNNNKAMDEASDPAKEMAKEVENAGESADKSGSKFDKLGTILKGSAVAMGAVAVAAGAAAIKLGKEVISQFGELEQNLGGSEAVFGEYAARIQKTGEDAYKNLGTSQSDYLATANKMGALFQGSGIEQQKSLELTEKAMQRAGDMASVMGIDMQVALDSVAGAAKGNFTMMDNLGVAMNATNIEAYALAKGLDFTWKTATQAEKAEVAMQMFFENTEQYAGNFAKESTETVTGSLGLLQAALGSFTAGLGNTDADMQNLTGNLVDAFQAVVNNVTPIIENLTSALPAVFEAILPVIGELLPQLLTVATDLFQQVLDTILTILPELIPVAVAAVMTIVDTLIENLPLIINGAIQLILALANGIIEALPELIPAVIDAVLTIAEALIDNIDMLIDAGIALTIGLTEGLIEALPKLIEKIPVIIEKLVLALANNAPKIMEAGIKLTVMLAEGLIKAIPQLVRQLPKIITSIVTGLREGLSSMANVGLDLVKGIWNGISDATGWILGKIKGFGKAITDGIKGIFGIHSPSTVFRDEVGKNLALGLGEGFTDEMSSITKDMNNAIPTDFEVNGALNMKTNTATNPSNNIAGLRELIVQIPVMLDGVEVARITAKPLSELFEDMRTGNLAFS